MQANLQVETHIHISECAALALPLPARVPKVPITPRRSITRYDFAKGNRLESDRCDVGKPTIEDFLGTNSVQPASGNEVKLVILLNDKTCFIRNRNGNTVELLVVKSVASLDRPYDERRIFEQHACPSEDRDPGRPDEISHSPRDVHYTPSRN